MKNYVLIQAGLLLQQHEAHGCIERASYLVCVSRTPQLASFSLHFLLHQQQITLQYIFPRDQRPREAKASAVNTFRVLSAEVSGARVPTEAKYTNLISAITKQKRL
jgi:hypothetical protein